MKTPNALVYIVLCNFVQALVTLLYAVVLPDTNFLVIGLGLAGIVSLSCVGAICTIFMEEQGIRVNDNIIRRVHGTP